MNLRRPWQGMMAIARFNWPFYLAAGVVLIAALCGLLLSGFLPVQLVCFLAAAGAAYFIFGSLGVSHLIYDRSDLYRWRWLGRALRGAGRERFIFCHSGFDEASSELGKKFADTQWERFDHFDEELMPERSIQRARRLYPPAPGTIRAPFDHWPAPAASADVVFGLLAIHELRAEAQRTAWFAEARRCLSAEGRVVLVEHVRDVANFLAFGPGFLHFHSPASWRRCWAGAGLRCADEFRITPWVRVFVLSA
ncbi:MAG: class I SAM-dependent methyltransferase [Chthoniobacteraceae bacterium]